MGSWLGDFVTEQELKSENKNRNSGLDAIRGLAILMVLISHSVIYYGHSFKMNEVALNFGYSGVLIFFVLSGFLITLTMIKEEKKFGSISLYNFYWRRALRLFPALWLYLAVIFLLIKFGWIKENPWHSLISSLFYIRNIVGRGHETDHLWSLSIEEQFYFVWPIVFICTSGSRHIRLSITVVLILLISGWRIFAGSYRLVDPGKLYIRSDFRFDSPLVGCLLAQVVMGKFRWGPRNLRLKRTLVSFSMILFFILFLIIVIPSQWFVGGLFSMLMLILSACLVFLAFQAKDAFSGFFFKPFVFLGLVSYGVYLWQQLFLGPEEGLIGMIRNPAIGVFCSLICAIISFTLIEKKFLSLKENFNRKD